MANEIRRDVSPSDIGLLHERGIRMSWGPIFGGTFATVALMVVMSLLGIAIGVVPSTEGAIGAGAGIWFLLSTIVALFVGGWTAAFMSGRARMLIGAMHGFITWCFASSVLFYLMASTPFGPLVAGAASVIGRGAAVAAGVVPGVAPEAVTGIVRFLPSAAMWGFLSLILGGAAAIIGGGIGVSRPFAAAREAIREEEEEEVQRFRRAG